MFIGTKKESWEKKVRSFSLKWQIDSNNVQDGSPYWSLVPLESVKEEVHIVPNFDIGTMGNESGELIQQFFLNEKHGFK